MQSVLVTVDRHEWYAPPQIYTRDDSSGLWTAKPAIQPESLQLSSAVNHIGLGVTSQTVIPSGEETHVEHVNLVHSLELADGINSMETSVDHSSEEPHSREESDVGTKKRRVSDLSANGIAVTDCSLSETGEVKSADSSTMESEVSRDYQGAMTVTTNASFAESVIEPTLVMFEVNNPRF